MQISPTRITERRCRRPSLSLFTASIPPLMRLSTAFAATPLPIGCFMARHSPATTG
jgi:hypothetical protein